jgi:hypothetical protein
MDAPAAARVAQSVSITKAICPVHVSELAARKNYFSFFFFLSCWTRQAL